MQELSCIFRHLTSEIYYKHMSTKATSQIMILYYMTTFIKHFGASIVISNVFARLFMSLALSFILEAKRYLNFGIIIGLYHDDGLVIRSIYRHELR